MKKIVLSIIFMSTAVVASAQKSEVNEAEKKWNIYDIALNKPENPNAKKPGPAAQPRQETVDQPATNRSIKIPRPGGAAPAGGGQAPAATAGTYVQKQLTALYDGFQHTEKAILNDKSKVMPEAWSYRALFASSVAYVDTLDVANSLKYQAIAEEAIAKAKTLSPTNKVSDQLKVAESYVNDAIIRRASVAYNKKDFAAAYDLFKAYVAKNPTDTMMYVNMALTAKDLKNYPAAIEHYKKAISMNAADAAVYYGDIFQINLTTLKDTAQAISTLREAQAKFPNEVFFITNEADILMQQGKMDEADVILDKLIARDAKNPLYLRVKADAIFNRAFETQETIRKLESAKKYKEADVVIKQRLDYLNKALPLYLKVEELTPKDVENLKVIKQIYFALNNAEKVAEYTKKQETAGN